MYVTEIFRRDDMKNIAAKLVKVMKTCGYIQKQGKNTFHNYKYAMAADVLEKVNAALVENGLATISEPELIDLRDVTTSSGKTEHLATVKTKITIIDSESGETISAVGLGSGQDAGDKAVMKAETASQKYAWMMTLMIATGDDPEADATVDERTAEKPKVNKPKTVLEALKDKYRVSDTDFAELVEKYGEDHGKIKQVLDYIQKQKKGTN